MRFSITVDPQLKNSWRWGKRGGVFQVTLTSFRASILRREAIVEKYNSHKYNQEHGQTWNSSEKPPLCFPFDVSSPMYFERPTLERKCLRSCSRSKHLLQFIWGPSRPSPNTKSSKANRLWFGVFCVVLFSCDVCKLRLCLVGFPPWSQAPHGSSLGGSGPPRSQELGRAGSSAGSPCASMQYNWRDLWFPISALKYSKLTKATVEFRTNTGGMFSYLFL